MNAFVTGGSRGIGRAIVLRLAAAGWGCAFTYMEREDEARATVEAARAGAAEAAGAPEATEAPLVRAYRMDQRDAEAVEATVEAACDDFGSIHAVVNNAAIVRNNAAAWMTDEEWDEVMRTDLYGPFYVTRAFLQPFIAQRHGRFVNIGSLAQDGSSGQANYAAAKAGLIGLTKTIAKEYGPRGITSNAVTVGYVETDMTREHMASALKDFWVTHCPTRRTSGADEIAAAVQYLISPGAESVNGHVLCVSGGLTYAP